jgi:hypothetical protein
MKKLTGVLISFNNRQRLRVSRELKNFGTTNLEECKDICDKLFEEFEEGFNSISLDLSNYKSYDENGEPIFEDGYTDKKTASYNIERNRLRIHDFESIIYENDNGNICRDRDALADTYQ